MQFKSSLSLYQCTLLPICTVATVQLLYTIQILTVTISVHNVTNMYGSHSTVTVCSSNPQSKYSQFQSPAHSVTNLRATLSAQFQLNPLMPPFSLSQSISWPGYGLQDSRFDSRMRQDIPLYFETSIHATRPTQPPIQWASHNTGLL